MILKFRYIVVFFLAFVCFAFQPDLHAQEYPDSVNQVVGKGSGINLNLLWYAINHGDIQWQTSPEGISWSDIPEETSKNLLTTAHSDMYYRAKIQSGTCDPLYSKITRLDIVNLSTISVDSVSVNSAQVSCAVYPEEYDVAEQGIFLDTEPYPDIYSIKVTDSTNIETFTIPLSDLTPGETYYVRTYARLGDDTYMFGNILSFSTLKISASNRINISDTTVRVFYQLSSTPSPEEHGVFYSTLPGPDSTSMKVIGIPDDNRFYAEITGLDPSTVYFAVPYMKVNGKYYMAEIIEFKTFSDYSQVEVDTTPFTINHKIIWDDPSTGKKISQDGYYAEYGRVRRIGDSDTLLLVHHGGPYNGDWVNISLVKSFDNGLTWTDQEILMDINDYRSDYWRFCCPEIFELENGWILITYTANGRPETNENCYVHILTSKDRGETWEGPNLITTGRSWEPAMVQLPGGELEMFYSSEARWWPGTDLNQEIHVIRSTNNGQSWSYPEVVAYFPNKRDGMPVPVLLQGNKGIIFPIECVNHWLSPWIIRRELDGNWVLPDPILNNGPTRWAVYGLSGFGGAPYIVQLPTGETVLSAHVARGGDWHQSNMQVLVGDNNGRSFESLTTPWGDIPLDQGAITNSLFLKDSETIVVISSRNVADGGSAIYWLEGKIVTK